MDIQIFSDPGKYLDTDLSLMVHCMGLERTLSRVEPDLIIENDHLRELWRQAREVHEEITKLLPKRKKNNGRRSRKN